MCKILTVAKNNIHLDPVVDRRGCLKKGYPSVIHPDTYSPSRSEHPPSFVVISCPELSETVARNYNNAWDQTVDYNVLDANAITGVYQVEVFGNNTNVSGEGAITQAHVETFLTNWNCVVDGFSTNSVIFTMSLWQALQSKGFWDMTVSNFTFVLNNYETETGVASVTVSGLTVNENIDQVTHAKRLIEQKGCIVISEGADYVVFEAERTDIFTEFKSDVQNATRGTWCRKQYYFSEALVDEALAMENTFDGETQLTWKGQVEVTQAELLAALNNKLDE